MKKPGILLLAAALAVCGLAVFSACDEPGHTHSFGEWTTVTEPTCTEEGLRERVCACGEKESEEIEAVDHTSGEAVKENEVAATCTEGGSYDEVIYCTICRQELSRNTVVVEPLPHSWVVLETVEASCEVGGYTLYECRCCGVGKTDDVVEPLCHNWVAVETIEPNCDFKGYTLYKCSRCGASKTDDVVEPLPHSWVVVETVKPNCYSNGYTLYRCSRCGLMKQDDVVESLLHSWVVLETAEASCEVGGYTLYECSYCRKRYIEYRMGEGPLGHEYVNGVCARCGKYETAEGE